MNLIELIKTLKNRKKIKLLYPAQIERNNSDTQPIITISQIEKILKDKHNFKDFFNRKVNQKFFANGLSYDDYVQAVRDYISFFRRYNVIFEKEVLKRASIITGDKYKNVPKKELFELDEIIAKLVLAPNTQSYIQGETASHEEILNALLAFSSKFSAQTKILALDEDVSEQIERVHRQIEREKVNNMVIQHKTKFIPELYTLNQDFEKLIMDKIPKNVSDKDQLAYEIYKAVCLSVQYDTGYFIKKNDKFSQEFIHKLKNKSISELNENHNRVICTNWTELYCYFLAKFGMESSIVENKKAMQKSTERGHCYAEVYLDDDIISADATQGIIDNSGINMTDMSRIKLGIPAANFRSRSGRSLSFSESIDKSKAGYNLQKDVDTLITMIDEERESKNIEITASDRLEILKRQLQAIKYSDVGNHAMIQYMRALYSNLFENTKGSKIMGISSSLYKQDAEQEFSFYPVIYMLSMDGDYRYYTFDSEDGLKGISSEAIMKKIEENELFVMTGKEGNIPGIRTKNDCQDNNIVR